MLSRLLSLLRALAVSIQPLVMLLTRVIVGWIFMLDGWRKLHNLDKVTEYFASLGIPAAGLNALFISTLQLVGGICLIAGLGTRIFAALLSCAMFVALLTGDRADVVGAFGNGEKDLLDIASFTLLLFCLWLVAFGPGAISIDRWLANRKLAGASK
jgi:putative oxidoreductase